MGGMLGPGKVCWVMMMGFPSGPVVVAMPGAPGVGVAACPVVGTGVEGPGVPSRLFWGLACEWCDCCE